MSTAELKLQLIRLIDNTEDTSLLKKAHTALSKLLHTKEKDWWDSISIEEKAEIKNALDEIERGEIVSHDKVMRESCQLLNKQKK